MDHYHHLQIKKLRSRETRDVSEATQLCWESWDRDWTPFRVSKVFSAMWLDVTQLDTGMWTGHDPEYPLEVVGRARVEPWNKMPALGSSPYHSLIYC